MKVLLQPRKYIIYYIYSYIYKTIPAINNNNYISDNKLITNINIRIAKNVKNCSGKHSITKCVE